MTSKRGGSSLAQKLVLFSSLVLVAAWLWANVVRLAAGQNGVLTFFLGSIFSILLLFRAKPHAQSGFKLPSWALIVTTGGGFLAVAVGILVPVHQLDWLGVLLVLYAALAWVLPARFGRDLALAMILLYWIHPLPSQLFGPLQLTLQWLSVKLSEGLLHIFNIRVWGDGFVLRTGGRIFGVPEACSGMKTAVTVLFCAVGVGLLMRLRPLVLSGLMALGLVQVLLLNVIRISGIVWMGMDKPPDWNEKVLHDTMGVFLLLAVALIHLDAALIRQWVARRAYRKALDEVNDSVGEDDEKIRRWPVFWRFVFTWWRLGASVLLVGVFLLVMRFRLSPYHRMEMIRGVAEGLMTTSDLENAERAVMAGLVLDPGNDNLLVDLARIKINRGRQEDALRIIRRKPVGERGLIERVLEAQALIDLKRMEEVSPIVAALPRDCRNLPGVALILAEFNAILDKPNEVAANVEVASHGLGTQEGLRALFPYMASRDLWDSIRKADSDLDYAVPLHGVIAADAHLRVNDITGAANVLRRALKNNALNPAFLNPVTRVAHEWPDSEWVGRFEAMFMANLAVLKPTDLTLAMDGAFAVGRADLGWVAYQRLKTIAPDDPMLTVAPAEYGRKWFQFRHQHIGVEAPGQEVVDIKPFLQAASILPPWRDLWSRIPLADELGGIITREGYQRHLKLCVAALERMEARGPLEYRLQILWGRVLGELGRWDEAHAKLDSFEVKMPRRHRDFLLAHADLYKARGDWELCFEALSEYVKGESHPPLAAWIDLANAAMALDLGAYAMGCMEEARRDYPESEEWSLAMAGMWSFFGFNEEALFVVNGMRNQPHASIRAKLLVDSGRVTEGQKLMVAESLPESRLPARQAEMLPPAEWVLEWRGGSLQPSDYEREGKLVRDRRVAYLKGLAKLKRQWYASKGGAGSSQQAEWEAVGRDAREKAMALDELALLLMRQGRFDEADAVVSRAVELKPQWSLLWRLKLILANACLTGKGKAGILSETAGRAAEVCPLDGDLWLANMVAQIRNGAGEAWAGRVVAQAVDRRECSPGTLVRAGEYLTRQDCTNAARLAISAAIKNGQGLVPAYVAGIACAIKTHDYTWALACARAGADQALEPWPFYKIIIGLKIRTGKADADVIRALEGLASEYPEQNVWAEQLGEIYFRKGQTDRALGVLEDALAREEGKKQAQPRIYLMAAESARREGNMPRAIKILEACRSKYPDDINVLNNLVFTLAQDAQTLGAALGLLPLLEGSKRSDFAVYDTVALVYMRSGNLPKAEEYMQKALSTVKKGDYAWLEVYLNAAEAQIRMGRLKEARDSLNLILKSPERSNAMDIRLQELQGELSKKEREQNPWF